MSKRVRRSMACAALVVGGGVALAGPARATGDSAAHFCDLFVPADDGALTDPSHHYLEPYVPGLHQLNCQAQVNIEQLSCTLPALAFLRSPTYQLQPFLCP